MKRIALFFLSLTVCCIAQAQSYGPNVTLEQAKAVVVAAEAEAVRQNWNVAIAVVDTAGNLVAFVKRDDTQTASVNVAQGKAGGVGLRALTLEGVVAAEGGVPLLVDGAIVGAIGVSGATSEQDGVVAAAGAAALQ